MNVPVTFFRPSSQLTRRLMALALLGAAAFAVGLIVAPLGAGANLLLVSYYVLGLGLGGLLFVVFGYVTGAGWGVALRRVAEALALTLPVGAVGLAAALLLFPSLYVWTDAEWHSHSPSSLKELWLNRPLFLARAAIYLAVWLAFAFAIARNSRRQDSDPALTYTRRNVALSAGFLVAFGITCWLASYDWIMSLEPDWYSTVFGVYIFAGFFLGGLAAILALVIVLQRVSPLRRVVTADHLHDLGKLLFGMSIFWMYIWFCQYMLIWYVNNPEETSHYTRRLTAPWQTFFWLNVLLNGAAPFLVLLPRAAKRNPAVLLQVCLVVLAGRWLDLYLLIVPAVSAPIWTFGLCEIGAALAASAVFLLVFLGALGTAPLIPVNDPFLVESLPRELVESLPREPGEKSPLSDDKPQACGMPVGGVTLPILSNRPTR